MDETVKTKDLKVGKASESDALISAFCHTVTDFLSTSAIREVPILVAETLPSLLSCPDLLTAEQRSLNGDDYEKHQIFLCPNDHFSVLAVVWPAGIYSPIHDHQTWCTFGVLSGEIKETIYEALDDTAECREAFNVGVTHHVAGSISHMPFDSSNIHSMHNPGAMPAISIHIYGGNADKIGANVDKIYTLRT